MNIYIAPVQGHTDAAWRYYHHKIYGGNHIYFTPFIRCERGDLRPKDVKDFTSELNKEINLEPQVIFRNMTELELLLDKLKDSGAKKINLNMGCPFPLQTAKGRGAGFISNVEEAAKIPALLSKYPEIDFSVKMRLGFQDPDEWRGVMEILNDLKLTNIYLHPRVAKQQYGGDLYLDKFSDFLSQSKNPVVFNGDIKIPEDINFIKKTFPDINGIMTARGVLGRPSLASEFEEGKDWEKSVRIEKMLRFHRELMGHYAETLCGESQILSKIKPFWEYADAEIGRKAWKAIRKATNMSKYNTAVASINVDKEEG